ncbi:MAG: glycosyltransferase [Nanoarchaeota archaeon]
MKLSIVVPAVNEEQNVGILATEIKKTLKTAKLDYELIFVDDGSTDGTRAALRALHAKDKNVKVLSFQKNTDTQKWKKRAKEKIKPMSPKPTKQ